MTQDKTINLIAQTLSEIRESFENETEVMPEVILDEVAETLANKLEGAEGFDRLFFIEQCDVQPADDDEITGSFQVRYSHVHGEPDGDYDDGAESVCGFTSLIDATHAARLLSNSPDVNHASVSGEAVDGERIERRFENAAHEKG